MNSQYVKEAVSLAREIEDLKEKLEDLKEKIRKEAAPLGEGSHVLSQEGAFVTVTNPPARWKAVQRVSVVESRRILGMSWHHYFDVVIQPARRFEELPKAVKEKFAEKIQQVRMTPRVSFRGDPCSSVWGNKTFDL